MAKPKWGTKLKCQSCGAAFYDMNQPTPTCPKCETKYSSVVRGRRGTPTAAPAAPATPAAPAAPAKSPEAKSSEDVSEDDVLLEGDDDLDDVLEDDEEDEGLIEDTSDLDDDEDDMAEIKEHVEADIVDKE